MKRLHKFVLKSFIGPFLMTFFICVFILLMQFLWKYIDELVGKGLEWIVVAELLAYASLALVPMAFPLAMLLASIMTFGNLGENYELVAMKASGISLFRIMRPIFLVAILLTIFAFYFSNNILPKTNLKFGAVMLSVKKQKPEMVINEGVFTNAITNYSIKVERKSRTSSMMYDIMIYDHTEQNGNLSVTVADSGSMKISDDKKFMIMTLFNGETSTDEDSGNRRNERHEFRRNWFNKQVITVPLEGFDFERTNEDMLRSTYRMMNLTQLEQSEDSLYLDYEKRVRDLLVVMNYNDVLDLSSIALSIKNDSIRRYEPFVGKEQDLSVDYYNDMDLFAKTDVLTRALSFARSNKQHINQNVADLYGKKKSVNRYTMEKHKKFTWPLACLIFFFIGAPLGAIIRKGGLGMPVVVSIFMFIAYYMVTISGEKFAREDMWLMFNGMWFSTFMFLPLGVFLSYKAANDSGIMNIETYQHNLKRFIRFITMRKEKSENENSSANQ